MAGENCAHPPGSAALRAFRRPSEDLFAPMGDDELRDWGA
jgi:hypothetical protein